MGWDSRITPADARSTVVQNPQFMYQNQRLNCGNILHQGTAELWGNNLAIRSVNTLLDTAIISTYSNLFWDWLHWSDCPPACHFIRPFKSCQPLKIWLVNQRDKKRGKLMQRPPPRANKSSPSTSPTATAGHALSRRLSRCDLTRLIVANKSVRAPGG